MTVWSDWQCQTCADDPAVAPSRTCAPSRCLCGHPACHAYASFVPLPNGVAFGNVVAFAPGARVQRALARAAATPTEGTA